MRIIRKFINHINISGCEINVHRCKYIFICNDIKIYDKNTLIWINDTINRHKNLHSHTYKSDKLTITDNYTTIEVIDHCIHIDIRNENGYRVNTIIITDNEVFVF